MPNMTRDDVIRVIGSADDRLIAQIVGLGATQGELMEAHAWLSNDEAMMNAGRPLASSRVGQLIAILERFDEDAPIDPQP